MCGQEKGEDGRDRKEGEMRLSGGNVMRQREKDEKTCMSSPRVIPHKAYPCVEQAARDFGLDGVGFACGRR